MIRESLRHRLVAGARGQLLITIALLAASFVAQAGIARRFALRGLGEYTGTTLAIFLVSALAISTLPLAAGERTARYLESGDQRSSVRVGNTGFTLALVASVIAALAVMPLWGLIAFTLQLKEPVPSEAIAVGILCAGMVGYVPALFQARLQMAAVGLMAIMHPLAVVSALGIDTLAPGIRPGAMAIAGYAAAGLMSVVFFLATGHRPRLAADELGPLLRQALRSLPLLYANVLSAWTDRLMVSVLLGPQALGTYQAAASIADGLLRIPRNASSFLVAAYARLAVAREDAIAKAVGIHVRVWTSYAMVVAAAILAGADGIATTAFGFGSGAVGPPLQIMALGVVPAALALSLVTAVTGGGEAGLAVRVARVTVPLQVVLVLLLAPILGVVGAAVAHLVTVLVTSVAYLRLTSARVAIPVVTIAQSLALGLPVVGLAWVIAAMPVPWPLRSGLGACAAAALGVSVLLGREGREFVRLFARPGTR